MIRNIIRNMITAWGFLMGILFICYQINPHCNFHAVCWLAFVLAELLTYKLNEDLYNDISDEE